MSGIYTKESRRYANRTNPAPAPPPKMVTFSIRCWDSQIAFLKQAVETTGIPQPDYILETALDRAAKDLKTARPEFPPIRRKPTRGTTPAERVAKMQGLSLKSFQEKVANEIAERMLSEAPSATDSAPRKASGTTRRG